MKATYGVMGMMEWVALIPTANNTVRVRFSGGSLSGYGVTPATFTTANPVLIQMIENSSYFRSGKIRVIKKEASTPRACSVDNGGKFGEEKRKEDSSGSVSPTTGMVVFKKEKP